MSHPQECYQSGSVLVVTKKQSREKESLNLRVPPELKQRVVEYANQNDLSYNKAACILLGKGLQTAARKTG